MMNVYCADCQHYIGGGICQAFDGPIPDAIVMAENDHTSPVEGDHGLQFKAKEAR